MDLSRIFKAYDIRGLYPDEIDEVACYAIGGAFAVFHGGSRMAVGRDMRLSSEPLARAFVEGVTSQGCDVLDIGLVSTDALYFASGRYDVPGAMFTASHNPGQYNGIKMCLQGAVPVGQDTGLSEVHRLARSGLEGGAPAALAKRDIIGEFAEHVLSFIDASNLAPLKVVVDAANGMGGKVVPPVFERLPVELIPMYFELDGTFPNHPADPIQEENLADLRAKVEEVGADVGMAFDGDADRVFFVDEEGTPVSGSLTTALVASRILSKEKGGSVVHNLICSRIVPETVESLGGKPIRTRVGHSFIKQVMAETGAVFGGEHSGHYYFRDNYRADSGLICALYVLEALSYAGRPMSKVLEPFRRYWDSGEINSEVTDSDSKMKELAAAFPDAGQDWMDGLTVEFEDWWFNVRPSNTEPLLRLNVEASDEHTGRMKTDEILAIIKS